MRRIAFKIFIPFLIIVFCLSVMPICADSKVSFSFTRNNTISCRELYCIEYVNNRFVAVGYSGVIITSKDGINWFGGNTKTCSNLHSVAYGNGLYIAVGDDVVLESRDGTDWIQTTQVRGAFRDIAFNNGIFVAAAYNRIYCSKSGRLWTPCYLDSNIQFENVLCDGKQFICTGSKGAIVKSPDGVSWTKVNSGLNWKINSIAWDGIQYVAVGEGGHIAISENLTDWTIPKVNTKGIRFCNVTYANDTFVAVGGDGDYRNGLLYASRDGINWDEIGANLGNGFYGITWGDGRFVSVGGSWGEPSVTTSTDGYNWELVPNNIKGYIEDIVYGGDIYIAVGDNGLILYSSDGDQWSKAASPTGRNIYSIAGNGDKYVAVGAGREILTSEDGVNWESKPFETDGFTKIAWGNGRFVSIGFGKEIVTSEDGVSWNKIAVSPQLSFEDIVFGDGKFLLLDHSGRVMSSTDGFNWSTIRAGDFTIPNTSYGYTGIDWVNDRMTIYSCTQDGSRIYSSPDGIIWTEKKLESGGSIEGIAYNGDTYLAYGSSRLLSSLDCMNWNNAANVYFKDQLLKVMCAGKQFIGVGVGATLMRIYPASSTPGLKSSVYSVGDQIRVIEVKPNTDADSFISGIEFINGTTFRLLDSRGTEVTGGTLKSGTKLVITSEDATENKEYGILIQKDADTAITSNAYKISGDNLIYNVPEQVSIFKFVLSLYKPKGSSLYVYNGKHRVNSGLVYPGMTLTVTAADGITSGTYFIQNKAPVVYLNNVKTETNYNCLYLKGKLIAPAEEICKKLKLSYSFDSKTGTIKIKRGNMTIETKINSSEARINGKKYPMPVQTIMIGTPYMPFQFLSEKLGFKYVNDTNNNLILLTVK